jgi:hypothetical protein
VGPPPFVTLKIVNALPAITNETAYFVRVSLKFSTTLVNVMRQIMDVIATITGEEKVREYIPPPFPQSMMDPEKATKQYGHLGRRARKIPGISPIIFFPAETFSFFLQGLQEFLDVVKVIIKYMAAISTWCSSPAIHA